MQTTKTNYRWGIVALVFFATTINYIDRQVLSQLKPALEKDFNWTETDYAHIVTAFSIAYALGLLCFGRWIDIIGTKLGYIISVVVWSISAIAHALITTTFGFGVVRVFLGLSESGNFPAAIRTVTEWFPKKERAFATGFLNSGTSVGPIVTPVAIPLIYAAWGWQMAFVLTGALGFIWLFCWIRFYRPPSQHRHISKEEFDYIHSDSGDTVSSKKMSWLQLLAIRQTWAFVLGKFLTDPIWWFFLFWLPSYFSSIFSVSITKPGWALVIVYTATTIGSISGGYASSYLIKKGWHFSRARKAVMFICAFAVMPVAAIQFTHHVGVAIALLSLAAASHQAWSANIFTTASDFFPKQVISSVIGLGGMAGATGGILFPLIVGALLDHYKGLGNIGIGYNILFLVCGSAYMIAWLLMHILMRKKHPIV